MPASRPTFPSEPHPRRLGTGGGPGGGERLLRTQLVIALILGFTILAVLLYLWRRPSGTEHAAQANGADPSASAAAAKTPVILRTKVEPPPKKPFERVKVGAVQHLKCGASPRPSGEGSLCDSLPFFEQALTKAITDTADCAPKGKEEGSINYVLVVDFHAHDVRLYPGRSGTWRGKQAKTAAECVKRAIPAPVWDTVTHQYRYYKFAALATYASPPAEEALPNFQ
jgi:hypothetical protein